MRRMQMGLQMNELLIFASVVAVSLAGWDGFRRYLGHRRDTDLVDLKAKYERLDEEVQAILRTITLR